MKSLPINRGATNEWEADGDLPGTLDMAASTDDLTVTGMGGNDTISTGLVTDTIYGGALLYVDDGIKQDIS